MAVWLPAVLSITTPPSPAKQRLQGGSNGCEKRGSLAGRDEQMNTRDQAKSGKRGRLPLIDRGESQSTSSEPAGCLAMYAILAFASGTRTPQALEMGCSSSVPAGSKGCKL